MKRIEIVVLNQDAALLRALAACLRRDDASARKLRAALRSASSESTRPSIADVLDTLPDISGPEFDAVFQEIERFRNRPVIKQPATALDVFAMDEPLDTEAEELWDRAMSSNRARDRQTK